MMPSKNLIYCKGLMKMGVTRANQEMPKACSCHFLQVFRIFEVFFYSSVVPSSMVPWSVILRREKRTEGEKYNSAHLRMQRHHNYKLLNQKT